MNSTLSKNCFDNFGPPTTQYDKRKDIFKGMGKLRNHQLKLHVDESNTSIENCCVFVISCTEESV